MMDSPKLVSDLRVQEEDSTPALFSFPNQDEQCEKEIESDPLLNPKKQRTPLPLKSIFVLSIVMISEPMIMTILFPFIYYMVCKQKLVVF